MDGDMEDSHVDVMDIGEEVEVRERLSHYHTLSLFLFQVDLHEEDEMDLLDELEAEEDDSEEPPLHEEWQPIDTTINGEIVSSSLDR